LPPHLKAPEPTCCCARPPPPHTHTLAPSPLENPRADLLLLHADSGSRKLTLRSLAVPQGSPAVAGQLRVAELKLASSAGSLVCLRCRCARARGLRGHEVCSEGRCRRSCSRPTRPPAAAGCRAPVRQPGAAAAGAFE